MHMQFCFLLIWKRVDQNVSLMTDSHCCLYQCSLESDKDLLLLFLPKLSVSVHGIGAAVEPKPYAGAFGGVARHAIQVLQHHHFMVPENKDASGIVDDGQQRIESVRTFVHDVAENIYRVVAPDRSEKRLQRSEMGVDITDDVSLSQNTFSFAQNGPKQYTMKPGEMVVGGGVGTVMLDALAIMIDVEKWLAKA